MSCDKPAAGEEVGTSRESVQHGMATHAALQATRTSRSRTRRTRSTFAGKRRAWGTTCLFRTPAANNTRWVQTKARCERCCANAHRQGGCHAWRSRTSVEASHAVSVKGAPHTPPHCVYTKLLACPRRQVKARCLHADFDGVERLARRHANLRHKPFAPDRPSAFCHVRVPQPL